MASVAADLSSVSHYPGSLFYLPSPPLSFPYIPSLPPPSFLLLFLLPRFSVSFLPSPFPYLSFPIIFFSLSMYRSSRFPLHSFSASSFLSSPLPERGLSLSFLLSFPVSCFLFLYPSFLHSPTFLLSLLPPFLPSFSTFPFSLLPPVLCIFFLSLLLPFLSSFSTFLSSSFSPPPFFLLFSSPSHPLYRLFKRDFIISFCSFSIMLPHFLSLRFHLPLYCP